MKNDRQPNKQPDKRNWKERFYKTIPMVDANGDPIPQDPPLNSKGFWDKPKPMFHEQIKRRKK